jgi:hypothetical protein
MGGNIPGLKLAGVDEFVKPLLRKSSARAVDYPQDGNIVLSSRPRNNSSLCESPP